MRTKKKILAKLTSSILACLLVFGMAFTVSAKTFEDVPNGNPAKEQIDILSDIGVIVGTSENEFSPELDVSREQMAMLLFRFMLGRSNAGSINNTAFTDLYDSTYHGAISWANAAGYIIGTSSETFDPTGGITLQDAMTILVRALGHSTSAMDRGYPWTYIDAAIRLGLDRGLEKISYTATLTRGDTAVLLYNALTADYLITRTSSSGITYAEKTTIIENVFGYAIEDSMISATNQYAMPGFDNTIKNGYISVKTESGKVLTVSFDSLGLEGSANDWLGRSVKVIYKTSSKDVSVLGASYTGKFAVLSKVNMSSDGLLNANGVSYKVVETLSDILSTNANELLVYAYGSDGKLVQLKNASEVAPVLGFYSFELIFDDSNAETANRAIIRPYRLGKLILNNGMINLAENKKADELTGGYENKSNAVNGDYVLYYYNSAAKQLIISETLSVTGFGIVTKLSASKATIDGTEYTLGCETAGISASSIAAQLAIGQSVSVVVKDGMILAVINPAIVVTESTYLAVVTEPVPVYAEGTVRYALTVNINGQNKSVFTNAPYGITAGNAYRYTVDPNGFYTLIPAYADAFVQNGDLKLNTSVSEKTTISTNGNPYYEFGGIQFVTSNDTVILVGNSGSYTAHCGSFLYDITAFQSANVTAVFTNNAGNVKTLKFMFISEGSLGQNESVTSDVKILSRNGYELIGSTVYTEYTVFDYSTGKVSAMRSLSNELTVGQVYKLNASSLITSTVSSAVVTGKVTGYTGTTLTVDGKVYALASDAVLVKMNEDNTVTAVTISDLYENTIEFIPAGNTIKVVLK